MRVGLVGCVKTKQPGAARAAELYTSPMFQGRRQWVQQTCDRWYVLSALHGLLHPKTVIGPYDVTLTDHTNREREEWSSRVLEQISEELGDIRGVVFEIHAGAAYRNHGLRTGLLARGATVEVPAEGLSQGEQLAMYSRRPGGAGRPAESDAPRPGGKHAVSSPSGQSLGGTYSPLREYLAARSPADVSLMFVEIERILGRPLPASARRHRPWWANDASHSQACAWQDAGYSVAAVDLSAERVSFHSR